MAYIIQQIYEYLKIVGFLDYERENRSNNAPSPPQPLSRRDPPNLFIDIDVAK